jgi:hypothetical protein
MRRRYVWKTFVCDTCGHTSGLAENGQPWPCPTCGGATHRPDPMSPKSPTVLGDTLWGGPRFIENLAPEPIWCETKSDYRALCAAHGMENRVKHVPVPGTDKSPVTQSWDIGPAHDPRPFALLSPDEQKIRREEAAIRLGFTVDQLASFGENLEASKYIAFKEPDWTVTFEPDSFRPKV